MANQEPSYMSIKYETYELVKFMSESDLTKNLNYSVKILRMYFNFLHAYDSSKKYSNMHFIATLEISSNQIKINHK